MSYSKTAICNLALGIIGNNREITDLEGDRSAQATACRVHYDIALDTTIRAHQWPFAKRTATLATIASYESDVWKYAYRVPSDFLYAVAINRTESNPNGERYETGGDSSGGVLYSNAEDAALDYIANVTTPGIYPPDFVDALSAQLAVRICPPLSAVESLRQAAMAMFNSKITQAMACAGNESPGLESEESIFLAARGTLS
jgi:hypothetical protein